MRCLLCKRLCDHDETGLCPECRKFVDNNNYLNYIKSLLREAYETVADIKLREKIERILNIK